MPTYFKALRRKIGVVTLVMACVFAVGWIRSLLFIDTIGIGDSSVNYSIASFNQIMRFQRLRMEPGGASMLSTGWHSQPISFGPRHKPDGFFRMPLIIQHGKSGIAWPQGVEEYDCLVVIIPYSSAVALLTLLSAYLLLTRPRAPKPMPPAPENA